ncbi:MAG: hypothetical protein QXU32_07335 [Nitrososphaerales archaeon]
MTLQIRRTKQTEVLSVRVEHMLVEELRNEAESANISLNVLVNHIFRRYIAWERDACKIGFVPITKDLFATLLERLEDSQLEQIAKKSANNIIDVIIYMKKKFDLNTCVQWLDEMCRASGFAKKRVMADTLHTYIVQHDLGIKYSIYLRHILKLLFDTLQRRIDPDITAQSVVFTADMDQ